MNTNSDFGKRQWNQYAEIQYTDDNLFLCLVLKNKVQQLHLISYWTMGNTLNLWYKGLTLDSFWEIHAWELWI